jgi:hypothetical protein
MTYAGVLAQFHSRHVIAVLGWKDANHPDEAAYLF